MINCSPTEEGKPTKVNVKRQLQITKSTRDTLQTEEQNAT